MTARLQDIEVVLADRPGSLAAFGETPRTGRGQPGGRRCFHHRLTGGGPLPRRRRCACTPGVGSRRDRTSDDPRRHHAATTPGSSRATWPPRRPDGRGRGQHRRPVQRPRSPPRARGISRAHHRCPEGRRHLECPTANESVRCLGPPVSGAQLKSGTVERNFSGARMTSTSPATCTARPRRMTITGYRDVRSARSGSMTYDVDDAAVWCADEEPAHAPWLCRDRVHDLIAEFSSFFVSTVDVVRLDGDHRVLACSRVTGYELDVGPRGGGREAGHPSHVEAFST